MFKRQVYLLMWLCISLFNTALHSQPHTELNIELNQRLNPVPPAMWGIFFEDINFAADGGLYAELVKNRSFSFADPMMGWKWIKNGNGDGRLYNAGDAVQPNKRYVELFSTDDNGLSGISNEGFRGIGVRKDAGYRFTVTARNGKNIPGAHLSVELADSTGKILAGQQISGFTNEWKEYEVILKPDRTTAHAHLDVVLKGNGSVGIKTISLFPTDTWKGRKNGLRKDLVELLEALKPGFIRFPGGCIVEGRELASRYQWKKTVGAPAERELIVNRWNTEFRHRSTPDYFQSFGLGFFEYFLLAEDLGAEPLPILNCGMACQFNTNELATLNDLASYIRDALDLVEFANGSTDTKWGKLRADMGHPEPFHLKMLGIGNEQWGPQYIERLTEFNKVLKVQHPEIKLITSAGPGPDGERFTYLWSELVKLNADFIDEHYYQAPAWFLKNASRYDSYPRQGPKVFAGEYAAHPKGGSDPMSRNNWESALAEAAFMTGLERNCDVVQMCSYAPLLAHTDAWQWNPDLIWFDNLKAVPTPNYYVQQLFGINKGSYTIPVLKNNAAVAGQDSLYASAVIDESAHELIVKVVNVARSNIPLKIICSGGSFRSANADAVILGGFESSAFNNFIHPVSVVPVQKKLKIADRSLSTTLGAQSVNVYRVKL